MLVKTVFSGFGGQGVLMMGVSFAHSGMSKGYHVTYLPAYGAEMRGPMRLSEVEAQQKEILKTVRRLADEGQIALASGGDAAFV
jgi:Pyruvate/2-oxoacid:ferredoxin oxidoreductase gamma subunit